VMMRSLVAWALWWKMADDSSVNAWMRLRIEDLEGEIGEKIGC
jgi:hypothetical protein